MRYKWVCSCVLLHLQLVCNQDDRFSLQLFFYALFKNVLPHVSVDCRQGVIEEEDVPVWVDGSGQADPLLLPPRQIQPSLPDLPKQQRKAHTALVGWQQVSNSDTWLHHYKDLLHNYTHTPSFTGRQVNVRHTQITSKTSFKAQSLTLRQLLMKTHPSIHPSITVFQQRFWA